MPTLWAGRYALQLSVPMAIVRLLLDKEVVINIKIIRDTVVITSKAFDGVDGVPEAQHVEISYVAFNPVIPQAPRLPTTQR